MSAELDLQLKVAEWRAKARAGTLTLDETRDAIKVLRSGRAAVAQASAGTKARKAKEPAKSGEDLLSELEGL